MRVLLALIFIFLCSLNVAFAGNKIGKLYKVNADQIAEYISSRQNKVAVLVYASWCPYCRKIMPDIAQIAKENPKTIVAISIDKNSDKLVQYLNNLDEVPFHVFIWNQQGSLDQSFDGIGITLSNGIPFIALVNEDKTIQNSGVLSSSEISSFLSNK